MLKHSLYLRDQKTGTQFKLASGPLPINKLPDRYTLVVEPTEKVGSVEFVLNGKTLPIEGLAPFRANGDAGVVKLNPGKNDLEVRIWEKKGGKGRLLQAAEYELIAGSEAPLPSHVLIKGVCEYFSAPIGKVAPLLKECQVSMVRGWCSIDWDAVPTAKSFDDVAEYKLAGFKTILCCSTKKPPRNAGQVRDWFLRAHDVAGKFIDLWEIGNEPNLNTVEDNRSEEDAYWIGTLRSHFDQVFTPAAAALKGRSAQIIGPSISKDLAALGNLVKWGMVRMANFAGYHPYGYSAREHVGNLVGAGNVCGPLPLAITEWNFHAADAAMWQRGIGICFEALKTYAAIGCYYRGQRNTQPAGKHGIFKEDYTVAEPYFSTFKAMK